MPIELQPHLQGALVELRGLRSEDFDALYAVARDPLIWEQHPARDRWQEPVFREYFRSAMASGGAFLVLDRADGAIIGCTRYHDFQEAEDRIEIGYTFLARSRWGGAYNGEMKRLLLRHAFGFVGTVVLTAGPQNYRSQRAIEKIGGVLVGPGVNAAGQECLVFHVNKKEWGEWRESNPRPLEPQSSALPS